ncbi:MAG: ABC transporter permease [Oscillospiraceae bacterium]|jgi:cell division transport system permease protein|nr:ABC transporter permease [Oscillospiraceae bacterium]
MNNSNTHRNVHFWYYIKEGFLSVIKNGFKSFALIFTMTACMLIMGCFALLSLNVSNIISKFEDENIILAYVDERLDEATAVSVKSDLVKIPNIASVNFVSRKEAMDSFVAQYPDKTRFVDIDESVFRHRYQVYVEDVSLMAETADAVRSTAGIAKITVNLTVAAGFVMVQRVVTAVSLGLIAILLVISLFMMSNTIKIAAYDRRNEIAIMRMVGATKRFIRNPFLFEGFILGVVAAMLAFILQIMIYHFVTIKAADAAMANLISMVQFSVVTVPMLLSFGAIGLGVGFIGSGTAIRKYLKV